jgi:hypothetical protein
MFPCQSSTVTATALHPPVKAQGDVVTRIDTPARHGWPVLLLVVSCVLRHAWQRLLLLQLWRELQDGQR